MNVAFASVASIDVIWPQIAQDMQAACQRCNSDYSAGDLWQMCRSGNGFLLVAVEGQEILMASVWRFKGQEFHCEMLWGMRRHLWMNAAREFVEKTARDNGAFRVVTEGRRGWLRLFKDAVMTGNKYEVLL